jgi:hypothetical protein
MLLKTKVVLMEKFMQSGRTNFCYFILARFSLFSDSISMKIERKKKSTFIAVFSGGAKIDIKSFDVILNKSESVSISCARHRLKFNKIKYSAPHAVNQTHDSFSIFNNFFLFNKFFLIPFLCVYVYVCVSV